jgi:hypothetical protein
MIEMREDIKDALDRYVTYHISPGGFLKAVLSNDLMGAIGRADYENRQDFLDICAYVYDNVPSICHGSPESVEAWLARRNTPEMDESKEAITSDNRQKLDDNRQKLIADAKETIRVLLDIPEKNIDKIDGTLGVLFSQGVEMGMCKMKKVLANKVWR